MIDKHKNELTEIVSSIYNNTFKVFKINSDDGNTLNPKLNDSYFISLGLTTSLANLAKYRNDLFDLFKDWEFKIVELATKQFSKVYLNYISHYDAIDIKQYDAEEVGMNRAETFKELANQTKCDIQALQQNQLDKISRLRYLICKLDNTIGGWEDHSIVKSDLDLYKIQHNKVNYKVEGGIEYRLGILAIKKD